MVGDDVEPAPDIDEALRGLREKHELLWITVADLDLIDGDGTGRDILDVEDGSPIPTILRGDRKLAAVYEKRSDARIAAQHAYFRARGCLALPRLGGRRCRPDAAAPAAAAPQGGVLRWRA